MLPNFHLVPIADITIGDRFRKSYGDIAALAKSISNFGLFEPIVLARDGRLLAGGRRLSAVRSIGWLSIPAQYIDEVDDLLVREIELEENIQREDLTWQEEALLVKAIDDLKRQIHGEATSGRPIVGEENGWSLRRTASLTGMSVERVHTNIRRAEAILGPMPSLAKETSAANADRALDRKIEELELELERRARDAEIQKRLESAVICGDATSLITSLPDASVDCIITDPPYGVDVGHGGGHRMEADFDDSPEAALAILRSIAPQCRRVLKASGHLYAFFGVALWRECQDIWRNAGFDVRTPPNIWNKPGGATGTTDWDHNFAPSWEPFLFASDRQRRLAFKRKNVFTFAVDLGSARHHPTQKPVELLRELVQLSTEPGDLIFDPFCGVGSTLVAASQLRRMFLGYELNSRYCEIARKRVVDEGKERPYVQKTEL